MSDTGIGSGEVWFRILTPKWAHAPLSGAGAAANGGRFNRPGLAAVYLAQDPMTAIEEYRQDMPVITPVTLAAYVIGPFDAIDLADGAPDDQRPVPWNEWRCAWKLIARIQKRTPPSWLCGDEALAGGIPAIRFPSTRRDGGVNLAVFPDLLTPSVIAVYDPDGALPKDQSSW